MNDLETNLVNLEKVCRSATQGEVYIGHMSEEEARGDVHEYKSGGLIAENMRLQDFQLWFQARNAIPQLISTIRKLRRALEFYADEDGGPYAPGDYHTADGGKRAIEALAKIESWE